MMHGYPGAAAAITAALVMATLRCSPTTAFFSSCQVVWPDAALGTVAPINYVLSSRRSGDPSSGGGLSWARRESARVPTSNSRFPYRARPCQQAAGGLLVSLDEGVGESNDALLLRMDFEHAEVEELREWIRRYPFGTALPVQPISLVQTEMGVDVVFRKKPTLERGSQDGGLRLIVEDAVEAGAGEGVGVDLPAGPTLTMRRISEGQEIRKMFAERIVVKAVVKSLAGGGAPPGTKVRTVLHEGLV